MAEESVLEGAIGFMDRLGMFEVVLPFLLVFTIVYAILDKTRVLGTEGEGDGSPRRNLNAMIAFCIAFLVVASTNLVRAISEIMANIVLLILLSFSFLLLVGSFYKPEDMKNGVFLEKGWKTTFMVIMFVGVVLIFLAAIQSNDSDICFDQTPCTWLEVGYDFMSLYWDSAIVSTIILLLLVAGFVKWVTTEDKSNKSEE